MKEYAYQILNLTNKFYKNYSPKKYDEYIEVIKNIDEIIERALEYLEEYINWFCGKSKLSKKKYVKRYKYSTLKYFHHALGIISEWNP